MTTKAETLRRPPIPWHRVLAVLRDSAVKFYTEDSLTVSASIAYYSLLCLFPTLLLMLGVGGIYLRHHELSGSLAIVMERYLPFNADLILRNISSASLAYGRVGIISFLLLLWGSSGVFLPLEKALNRAWNIEPHRSWWRSRLLALEMALISAFLILVSLLLVGVSAYLKREMHGLALSPPALVTALTYRALIAGAIFGMTLIMFLIVLVRLPNRPMRIRQILPSALVTALLWEVARNVFTRLLPFFNYRHIYGSIGAIVAFMTWAYISSAIALFGAQISSRLYRTLDQI